MKRITEQEAKQFIPLKENYNDTSLSAASYFTITPSEQGDGWEDVTYFTARKRNLFSGKEPGGRIRCSLLSRFFKPTDSIPRVKKLAAVVEMNCLRPTSTGVWYGFQRQRYVIDFAFGGHTAPQLKHSMHSTLLV